MLRSFLFASVVLVQVAETQGISPGRYAGPGGLTLTVTPGRYSVVRQERELIGGVLRLGGDTLEMWDDAGAARCAEPGRYRVATAGDTLRFAAIEDACAGRLPNLHEELALLVRAGLTPLDALIAATRTGAEALGMSASHGTIEVGKAADLLVLRADPLADIRNSRQIDFVVKRGKIVEKSP